MIVNLITQLSEIDLSLIGLSPYKDNFSRVNKKILFLALLGVLVLPVMAGADNASAPSDLQTLIGNVETVTIDIATPLVIIGWIIAGILYLTAAGSPEKLGIAKKALVASVIGTILVVLAIGSGYIISIISNALGIPSTTP